MIAAQSSHSAVGLWHVTADDLNGHQFTVDFQMEDAAPTTFSLTSGIALNQVVTSLSVTRLPAALSAGGTITLGLGTSSTQTVIISAPAPISDGPTTVSVTSFTATSAFPAGSIGLINDPLSAIIDHFGLAPFGLNEPAVTLDPGNETLRLAGHGFGPTGVARTYRWIWDLGTSTEQILTTSPPPASWPPPDTQFSPGTANLFNVVQFVQPPKGMHTVTFEVCGGGTRGLHAPCLRLHLRQ